MTTSSLCRVHRLVVGSIKSDLVFFIRRTSDENTEIIGLNTMRLPIIIFFLVWQYHLKAWLHRPSHCKVYPLKYDKPILDASWNKNKSTELRLLFSEESKARLFTQPDIKTWHLAKSKRTVYHLEQSVFYIRHKNLLSSISEKWHWLSDMKSSHAT